MEKWTCRKNCELFLSYNFATLFFLDRIIGFLKKIKSLENLDFLGFLRGADRI